MPARLQLGQSLSGAWRAALFEPVEVEPQVGFEFAVEVGEEVVQSCGRPLVVFISAG
jgi:hypothetical protein